MPLQGTLKAMPVPELLTWISQCRKTGTLEIRANEATHTMSFSDGELIYSSSSNPECTLGRLLLQYGAVTKEEHERARELRETRSMAVAKALLEIQALNEPQLLRFLRKKAEKEIFDLMEAEEGEFTFREDELPALDLLPLRVDVSKMLMRVTQDRDEKGEYDFDSSGIRLDIPRDI
jgi:uncharacterized protein DUF4388